MKKLLHSFIALIAMATLAVGNIEAAITAKNLKLQNQFPEDRIVEIPTKWELTGSENKTAPMRTVVSDDLRVKSLRAMQEADKLYKVKVVYDGQEDFPSICIYNEDFYVEATFEGWDQQENYKNYVFEIPAGTYDISVNTWLMQEDPSDPAVKAYWVHENVVVDKDLEEVFSPEELTEQISIMPRLSNGDYVAIPTGYYTDNYEFILDNSRANAQSMVHNYAFFKGGCDLISAGFAVHGYFPTETNEPFSAVFRFNKISSDYHFISDWGVVTNDNVFERSVTDFREFKAGDYSNYIDGFVEYPFPEFTHTPLYTEDSIEKFNTNVKLYLWLDNIYLGGLSKVFKSEAPKVISSVQPTDSEDFDIKAAIVVEKLDYDKTVVEILDFGGGYVEEFEVNVNYGTISLPAFYNGTNWVYVNQNHSECGNYSFQVPADGSDIIEYPGLPAYSFMEDEITAPFGNSAPILSHMMQQTQISETDKALYFAPNAYIGRYGEVRRSDQVNLKSEVYLDGEKIFESTPENTLENWIWQFAFDGHEKGELELVYTNNNVRVDDVDGFNITKVKLDERNDDPFAPTTQMLIFKDRNGVITDRFDKAENGIVEFSAGDFNYVVEDYSGYYTCAPITVKLEYAPYGTTDFAELNVEEVPENYYMPGFGYFYRGSLADVDAMSANGWYDLRFTLTDEAGNSMEQHLSPAFKISELSSIEEVVEDDDASFRVVNDEVRALGADVASLELYAIDGRKIASAAGSSASTQGYKGVVIARSTTTTGTTTTRLYVK